MDTFRYVRVVCVCACVCVRGVCVCVHVYIFVCLYVPSLTKNPKLNLYVSLQWRSDLGWLSSLSVSAIRVHDYCNQIEDITHFQCI